MWAISGDMPIGGAEMAREILGQLHAPRALQDRVATPDCLSWGNPRPGAATGRPASAPPTAPFGGRRRFGTCWPWTGRMTVERARLRTLLRLTGLKPLCGRSWRSSPASPPGIWPFPAGICWSWGCPRGRNWGASSGPSWRKWETAVCPTPQRSSSAGQRCCTNGTMQTDGKAEFCNGAAAPLASPGKAKALPLPCKRENAIRCVRNMRHCTPM